MRALFQPLAFVAAVALCVVAVSGCGGTTAKKEARRVRNRCDVSAGQPISEEQARCIAGLFGVRDRRRCPMELDRPDGFREPVYRVVESCNGLGVVIARSNGRVMSLVAGDDILH